jgi:uncharacterized Zn finger protein (UPF0148 family)
MAHGYNENPNSLPPRQKNERKKTDEQKNHSELDTMSQMRSSIENLKQRPQSAETMKMHEKTLNSRILVHFKVRFGTRLIGFISEWVPNFHEVQRLSESKTGAIVCPLSINKTLGKSQHATRPTIQLLASRRKQRRVRRKVSSR